MQENGIGFGIGGIEGEHDSAWQVRVQSVLNIPTAQALDRSHSTGTATAALRLPAHCPTEILDQIVE